jgi:hypothetical protein
MIGDRRAQNLAGLYGRPPVVVNASGCGGGTSA